MNGLAIAAATAALVAATAPVAPTAVQVRLGAFRCGDLSDQTVRGPLKVELRDRLLDEGAPSDTADFVLVSIACEPDAVNILSVQQTGGLPVRRRVSLGGVGLDARARSVAVTIAELLRGAPAQPRPAVPPTAAPAPVAVDGEASDDDALAARLELVELSILLPLTTARRAGVRTRIGNTDVPNAMDTPNFYVFSIEPFVDLALGRDAVATLILPMTWTEGPALSSWGRLANLTAAIRYATGERLRAGIGAALSINVGDAPPAQAESNRFELDRFRDATHSLRLQADALWRAGRLFLQGEAAVLLLADQRNLGTLFRGGAAGGLSLSPRAVVSVEYLVLSDAFDAYFTTGDRFVQALIAGTRFAPSRATTVGVHFHISLDQGPNLGAAGVLSAASTF